ncbi:hypothetical protein PoB_003302600 [Plakobranchus ocellatus]|uniref:Uncharacterized protein n=1 Tax=Plakobranchus ocellatus TaxID=259542 RepID=A0AAV4A5L5_9GAST|nr:hypothetical protein PoB_003302600 [Plakobranchus ocellatus]
MSGSLTIFSTGGNRPNEMEWAHKRSTRLAKMILKGTVQRERERERCVTEWTGLRLGEALHKRWGVGGTVACEFALRSAGSLLSRIPAPPSVSRPDGRHGSLRSPCCGLAIYKTPKTQPDHR